MNPANSQQALAQLQGAQQSAQDPNSILQDQQNQLGVGAARNTVTGLRGAIDSTTRLLQQVAPSVMGRTQGSLVTQAQATRQIGNEQAPLNTALGNNTNQYNEASTNLSDLQNQAQTAASGIYTGQQNKLSYLQNIYNSLFGQEQAQIAQQQEAAKLAEQAREADLTAATSRASGNPGINLGSLLGGNSTPQPGMKLKGASGSSGYAFTDSQGHSISANQYAQLTGQNLGTLLHTMGSSGDQYAQQAYNQISKNLSYYNAHPEVLKSEFKYLF